MWTGIQVIMGSAKLGPLCSVDQSEGTRFASHCRARAVSRASSQMVPVHKPRWQRAFSLRRSRAWLPSILAFQKARRDFGRRKPGQFSCPCQKQLWTKKV